LDSTDSPQPPVQPRSDLTLVAYFTGSSPAPELVPAPATRRWMQDTIGAFAQRCLPMLIANQAGWWILNRAGFRATWDGSDVRAGVAIEALDGGEPPPEVGCQFGYGIVTWTIPYLFRTPRGYNLLARGPANLPKRGAVALEGLVETDWAVATFTMNWQLTEPGHPVVFAAGEPFCMILPQQRGEIESCRPERRDLHHDPALAAAYDAWNESREIHRLTRRYAVARHGPDHPDARSWQGDYFRGVSPGGAAGAEHQTRLHVLPFATKGDEPAGLER
jgi:hypothetical protein